MGGNVPTNWGGGPLGTGVSEQTVLAELTAQLLTPELSCLPDTLCHRLPPLLTRRHRLAPLCYRLGAEQFHVDFMQSALAAELWKRSLEEVLSVFDSEGIEVLRLKGIAYIDDLYADPGERPMGDLDLLVQDRQVADALGVLNELGYRCREGKNFMFAHTHHALTLDRIGPSSLMSSIDLHRSMMQRWRTDIDLEGIWARADLENHRPDPIDEVLLHLSHIVRHELMVPLSGYVDLSRLLKRLDGREELLERCRLFRVGRGAQAVLTLFDALRQGPEGHRGAPFPLPSRSELMKADALRRSRQLVAKLSLVEGPGELVGLALVTLYERMFSLSRGRS